MAKTPFFFTLVFLMLSAFGTVQATIYENTLPDGSINYSDTPTPNSRPVTLSRVGFNDFTPPHSTDTPSTGGDTTTASPTATANSDSPNAAASNTYSEIHIVTPTDQTTFQNQNPIPVIVSMQPPLQKDDTVQLIVDGAPYGKPQSSLTFSLPGDLIRGTHQLQARIMTATGPQNVSQVITIYKHQASTLLGH